MKPNWTAIVMTGLTVLVGLTCLILALTLGKGNEAATGLLFSTAGAALGSFLKQPNKIGSSDEGRDKQAGHASPTLIFLCLFAGCALLLAVLAMPRHARAEGWETVSPGVYKSGAWTLHPNFAATAGQLNIKAAIDSGIGAESLERVALMSGYGFTHHGESLTVGAALYAGIGVSAKTPNAPQVNLLATFWDVLAVGPGIQRVTFAGGAVAYQWLFTVGLNYAAGGTVAKVAPWFDQLLNACATGAACSL